MIRYWTYLGSSMVIFLSTLVMADSIQPITLQADEVEVDFSTGQRVYSGNVVLIQDDLNLRCDKLVTLDNDEGLSHATCTGDLANFEQRSPDAEKGVEGVAKEIEMNNLTKILTLKNQATISQDNKTLSGANIRYDINTSKVKVGGVQQNSNATGSGGSARPSLTIKSSTKKVEDE